MARTIAAARRQLRISTHAHRNDQGAAMSHHRRIRRRPQHVGVINQQMWSAHGRRRPCDG
jgi:hypothetical protein